MKAVLFTNSLKKGVTSHKVADNAKLCRVGKMKNYCKALQKVIAVLKKVEKWQRRVNVEKCNTIQK